MFEAILRKFLGFFVSRRGVEANSEKIQDFLKMKPHSAVKDVQKPTSQITSLGRFVPKSADRCAKFFKIHQNKWTKECQKTFEDLKNLLS